MPAFPVHRPGPTLDFNTRGRLVKDGDMQFRSGDSASFIWTGFYRATFDIHFLSLREIELRRKGAPPGKSRQMNTRVEPCLRRTGYHTK